jgi:hypothetical protein
MSRRSCAARSIYVGPVKVSLRTHRVWCEIDGVWRQVRSAEQLPAETVDVVVAPKHLTPSDWATEWPAGAARLPASRGTAAGRRGRRSRAEVADLMRRPELVAVLFGCGEAYARLTIIPEHLHTHGWRDAVALDQTADPDLLAEYYAATFEDADLEDMLYDYTSWTSLARICLARQSAASPWLLGIAARTAGITWEEVAGLVAHPDTMVRTAVLSRPDCPAEVLAAHEHVATARIVIARHPNTPPEVLDRLARTVDTRTIAVLLTNPNLSASTLEYLLDAAPVEVGLHPNAPEKLRRWSVALLTTSDARDLSIFDFDALGRLLTAADCPPDVRDALLRSPLRASLESEHWLRANPAASPELLRELYIDPHSGGVDWRFAYEVTEHPNCPAELIDRFADDATGTAPAISHLEVAASKHTATRSRTPEIVARLAAQREGGIFVDALANPACPPTLVEAAMVADAASCAAALFNPTVPVAVRVAVAQRRPAELRAVMSAGSYPSLRTLPDAVHAALLADAPLDEWPRATLAAAIDRVGLSRDGLEMVCGLAADWSGTLDELLHTSRSLL